MAFRSLEFSRAARFNSALSSDFLDICESSLDAAILDSRSAVSHRTFAPSSMYCPLLQWFRLRGATPDKIDKPDRGLEFTAVVGTACHEYLQHALSQHYQSDWLDVGEYLSTIYPADSYNVKKSKNGFESLVELYDPPVRFAVDGLLNLDVVTLLEIKSSEHDSFSEMYEPKSRHIDQVITYCTLLHINRVLFVYIDRQYGDLKAFQYDVKDYEKERIQQTFAIVRDGVETNIAPEGLPKGDTRCSSNMCPYYKKCKQWRV